MSIRLTTATRRRLGRTVLASMLATLCAAFLMAAPAAAATTRSQIVAVATEELGHTGCNPGYYGSCGIEWCSEFARWVWAKAGVSDVSGLDSWAQSFKDYGKKRGLYHARSSGYRPQPGDAIVFDWDRDSSDVHAIDHVAIVTGADSDRVATIGGNQGDSDNYQSKVSRSSYSLSSVDIDGYVSPAGVGSEPPVDEPTGNSVTGDSYADLLAVDSSGKMMLYSNNFVRDDGQPYTGGTPREVAHGWPSTTRIIPADVTGDGYTDLLAVDSSGKMMLYSNNFVRDDGQPYTGSSPREVGHGWPSTTRIIPADVTGDGYTDLLAVDSSGKMMLYSNNFVRDDGQPFTGGTPREVGHAWSSSTRILPADVTGDGYTDLLAVDSSGKMMLYSNNIVRDDGQPFTGGTPREVGHGWPSTTRIIPADVTGDGYTDLLAVDAAGTMNLYSNNIVRDDGQPFTGSSPREVGHAWGVFPRILA
ncbi:FG-GAP repeat domain-containing protein [Nonomuraea jabiensis]|uniref:FG-GAP repeat domain-containing protein n=1 Tax=Nonomuraea jabiensis TaxID=882448 RepID=UPI0036A7B1C8